MDGLYGFESWRQHSEDLRREMEQARLARAAQGDDHSTGVKTLLGGLLEKFNGKVIQSEGGHEVVHREAARNRRCRSKAV